MNEKNNKTSQKGLTTSGRSVRVVNFTAFRGNIIWDLFGRALVPFQAGMRLTHLSIMALGLTEKRSSYKDNCVKASCCSSIQRICYKHITKDGIFGYIPSMKEN